MGLCELSADERKANLIYYPQMTQMHADERKLHCWFYLSYLRYLRHLRTGLISRRWTQMNADERKLHCWFLSALICVICG